MPIIPLIMEAISVIIVWVLKYIRFVRRVCYTKTIAPIIIPKEETIVNETNSSRPKKFEIARVKKKHIQQQTHPKIDNEGCVESSSVTSFLRNKWH